MTEAELKTGTACPGGQKGVANNNEGQWTMGIEYRSDRYVYTYSSFTIAAASGRCVRGLHAPRPSKYPLSRPQAARHMLHADPVPGLLELHTFRGVLPSPRTSIVYCLPCFLL